MNGNTDDLGRGKRRSRWDTPTDSAVTSDEGWQQEHQSREGSQRERRRRAGIEAFHETGWDETEPSEARPEEETTGDNFESQPGWPDAAKTENYEKPERRNGPSLKNRALAYLARREHSRVELVRKLAPYVRETDAPGALEAVIDELCAKGLISNARFIDAVVRKRAAGFGSLKIMFELKQHGLEEELI